MGIIAGLVGVVIGSSISLLSVFLNQRLVEKREDKRIDQKREEKAISEIYSPLVFLLDRTRELFVYILSFKQALEVSAVTKDELKEASFLLQYFTSKNLFNYLFHCNK
jgi:hypothetical protein